jgi:hypothetical protein
VTISGVLKVNIVFEPVTKVNALFSCIYCDQYLIIRVKYKRKYDGNIELARVFGLAVDK